MRFVHLSDLHFGTELEAVLEQLRFTIADLKPDLVIISGDFTQIANKKEFQKAADFIKSLELSVFCLPGNHDVPRFKIAERFLNPFKKYKIHINKILCPFITVDNIALVGINTARRFLWHWNWANGAISQSQIKFIQKSFEKIPDKFRVCVFHHPLHKAEKSPLKVKVFGAHAAMNALRKLKVDLVLTGHVHHASITVVDNIVFASASTAISHRHRNNENGFNVIEFSDDFFDIAHWEYNGGAFAMSSTSRHARRRHVT